MLIKQITYENPFTGNSVTEDHYFHISKADLVKMEVEEHKEKYIDKTGKKLDGMQAKLQRIVDAEDGKAIMAEFEDIIRRSFGKKDGDRFLRSPEIWADFRATGAYDQLLFELCTNAEAAAAFINGLVPGDLEKIAAEIAASDEVAKAVAKKPAAKKAAPKPEPRKLSTAEITAMDAAELQVGLSEGRYSI